MCMKRFILISLTICMAASMMATGYNREALYRAFLSGDLTSWHDFIAQHKEVSDDSLLLVLDLEYNYLAWASTQPLDDNKLRLGIFNRHISQYEQTEPDESELLALKSAFNVYALSILSKPTLNNNVKAITYAKQACNEKPGTRALMHRGFIYFYLPSYAGGNKEKALLYLRQAEKKYLKSKDKDYNWNLLNTQQHIAQCLVKLGRTSEAKSYIKRILKNEPDFLFLQQLLKDIE